MNEIKFDDENYSIEIQTDKIVFFDRKRSAQAFNAIKAFHIKIDNLDNNRNLNIKFNYDQSRKRVSLVVSFKLPSPYANGIDG